MIVDDDGATPYDCRRIPLNQVREAFRANPDDFADGANRILSRLDTNVEFENSLLNMMMRGCQNDNDR